MSCLIRYFLSLMFRPVTQTMQTCAPAVLKGAPFLLTPTSSTYHLVPRFEIEDTGVITTMPNPAPAQTELTVPRAGW
ncbi:hypothetical protein P167DRAFT_532657 [Morchella conica CCBAS932]|uniref:Uncharacterized protein n=1 Tax=Morchella conica CCBAS932 TaxID=1392247 RepID=A0A3N4L039_9PEZI|nr:hypothetical protein P167DRAFT_532657 [Morchella conica CCBAS932]